MTSLTIQVHDLPASLPAGLEERLAKSPTKSPEDIKRACDAHTEKTAKLRAAHLDAVRDRAARESERAKLVKAAKLRNQMHKIEKVQRKLDLADEKVNAKKEASDAERAARKERREALAAAVADAKAAAKKAKEMAIEAAKTREALAFAKHAKNVQLVQDKSAAQVKHALAVVEAHKQSAKLNAEAAADRLEARLEKAALHRAHEGGKANHNSGGKHALTPEAVRHRVLNDEKVHAEQRRLQYDASMARHESNRASRLQHVLEKAQAENDKAARVVAAHKSVEDGTDKAVAEAKSALYEKLNTAEVLRLQSLRSKVATAQAAADVRAAVTNAAKGSIIIIIKRDPNLKLRAPPAALSKRLSVVKRTLLATASSRQAGAAARRASMKMLASAKMAKANEKRAAALHRLALTAASKEAEVTSRAARSLIQISMHTGKCLANCAAAHRRLLKASARRTLALQALTKSGVASTAKCEAAASRHADKLRLIAKPGVVAVRHAAASTRRATLRASVLSKAEQCEERAKKAALHREAVRDAKMALAKKRMIAMHPKREVADMEVKEVSRSSSISSSSWTDVAPVDVSSFSEA